MSTDHDDEPGSEEILDWLEGRLTPERARAVESAVARPGSTAAAFAAWAREFHRLSGALPLPTPPPVLRQRLRQLYLSRLGRAGASTRQVARLEVDSRRRDPMVALRGPLLDAETRMQLSFSTTDADVVLDVAPSGHAVVTLRGQVLPRRPMASAFQAEAHGPSGVVSTVDGDELGSFTLEDVPVDTESVVLFNGELSIELPLSAASRPT